MNATYPAGGFVGTTLSVNIQASGRERRERSRITQLRQMMERLLWERPRVKNGTRPPQEQFLSLADAFAGVPDGLGFPVNIHFWVAVVGEPRELRPWLREEIYRIGQEGIINAYRHSCASKVEMEIEYRPAELRITVRDNGCGIDPQLLQHSETRGLQGMRERAERIGGRLRILSKVGLGTEVELCVPGRIVFEPSGPRLQA